MEPFSKSALLALAALVLLARTPAAHADVIYDATGEVSSGQAFTTAQVTGPLAESFSTGKSAFDFTNLELLLGVANPRDRMFISVNLLSDNAGSPGSLVRHLARIHDAKLSSWAVPSLYDIPVASIALAADTRYWIELVSPTGSTAVWAYTQDLSGKGVSREYDAYSRSGIVSPNSQSAIGAYQMAVVGHMPVVGDPPSIPEPASLTLLGVAVAGIGAMARRRPRAR